MKVLTLKAHYDGERICIDEPFELRPNTPLPVAVLSAEQTTDDRTDWAVLAKQALSHACGEDEPDYPNYLIRQKAF